MPDPLSELESYLSPFAYVANNPINFIDPFGLYIAKNEEWEESYGGPSFPEWPWPIYDDIEPPFGSTIGNPIGRYYPGYSRNVGPSYEEYMASKGYVYVENQYGIGMWVSSSDITIYVGSSYFLGGILNAALSGGITGIEAFVEDYCRRFVNLLANSSSVGDYGSGYGMMFDGDPKKKKGSPIIKFVGFHKGIPEFESRLMDKLGAATPGPFIIYPTGGSKNPFYSTHEPGHVLQYLFLGPINYYSMVAIPSLITARLRIHDYMPYEYSANMFWYWTTGEYDTDNPPPYVNPK